MWTAESSDRIAGVYYLRLAHAKDMTHQEISARGIGLLMYALAKRYGIRREDCVLAKAEHGKPYIQNYPDIHFNISNSGCYIVLAVSPHRVGIDIQEKRVTDIDKLGKRVFSVDDYRKFLASEDRQDRFFREWVRKEAYVKWTGEGLLRSLRDLPMDGWSQFIYVDGEYFCAIQSDLPLTLEIEEVTNL